MSDRAWTLDTATELLVDVRARTQSAVEVVDELFAQRDAHEANTPQHRELSEQIEARLARWAREMEALGVEVPGPWRVAFDTGGGYFCWSWPEEELVLYHDYDQDFDQRARIH